MASETRTDVLVAELTALGRSLPEPSPGPGLTASVMARLADAPAPAAESLLARVGRTTVDALARHRRRVAAVLTAVLLTMVAVPPVRATVADWFGFAGVRIQLGEDAGPSTAPPPPAVGDTISLDRARRLVGFDPVVPAELGPPDGVDVSADRRLLSMSWTGGPDGPVRLDQFDARLDYSFTKAASGVEFVSVAGGFAVWFDEPHEIAVLEADGSPRVETARLAGHTLIWEAGEQPPALRLEGDVSLARAIEIAESVALP